MFGKKKKRINPVLVGAAGVAAVAGAAATAVAVKRMLPKKNDGKRMAADVKTNGHSSRARTRPKAKSS